MPTRTRLMCRPRDRPAKRGLPSNIGPATSQNRLARSSTTSKPSRIVTPNAELRPGSETPMLIFSERASSASVRGSMPLQYRIVAAPRRVGGAREGALFGVTVRCSRICSMLL